VSKYSKKLFGSGLGPFQGRRLKFKEFFLLFVCKKDAKKLCLPGFVPLKTPVPQIQKVFYFFFSKRRAFLTASN